MVAESLERDLNIAAPEGLEWRPEVESLRLGSSDKTGTVLADLP